MSRRTKISPNQRRLFSIDDSDNVTYFLNGYPQTLEQLQQGGDFEDIDIFSQDTSLDLLGYTDQVEAMHEIANPDKEDDKTVQLSISDLEKIRRILTAIPQFRDLAAEKNDDIESIEFLAEAVQTIDFMSLPHFDVDMSIFDILVKNNPEYREFVFGTLMGLVNSIGRSNKFPTRRYLSRVFIDFTDTELEKVYQLLKRFLSMLNAWGGIQIHYFEQTVRDWMYIVYERGGNMDIEQIYKYLQTRYACKPDFELRYVANMIANSISFNTNLDEFVDEFIRYMHCFSPEQNIFLTQEEVYRLWTSELLVQRIKDAAQKWKYRMDESKIVNPEDDLEAYFGISRRLSTRVTQNQLPQEICSEDCLNESVIKLKMYFPEGYRTLIEARLDRFTRVNGKAEIYDWKTRKKQIDEMNDFEKLQIILQCISLQNVLIRTTEGSIYNPMVNHDYKFFIQSTNLEWVNLHDLPGFTHIPEQSEGLYDYVHLNISEQEAGRLLQSFSRIVHFLICNKKQFARIRRHLKNVDNYIPAPKILAPVNVEQVNVLEPVEA